MADGFDNAGFANLRDHLEDRLLVVYDGHCGFCNRSVRWFLVRDRRDRLRFAPSEAPMVSGLLSRQGLSALAPNTIVVAEHAGGPRERVYSRSEAVIVLLRQMGPPWPSAAALLRVIPRSVRDFAYTVVARLRYRIAGRFATCPIPTAEERRHFL